MLRLHSLIGKKKKKNESVLQDFAPPKEIVKLKSFCLTSLHQLLIPFDVILMLNCHQMSTRQKKSNVSIKETKVRSRLTSMMQMFDSSEPRAVNWTWCLAAK